MSRRAFIKNTVLAGTGVLAAQSGFSAFSAQSYRRIPGANDRIRVGVVGFSDRFKDALFPAFQRSMNDFNTEIVAVSDIWKLRREEGTAWLKQKLNNSSITPFVNNEALYASKSVDAVIISTADFQHALHAVEAVEAGCDAYVEKPFAETMADNIMAMKAVKKSERIVQIGSQRRSGVNYFAANEYINSGRFGKITMVELVWNVNQPGRWRRPGLVAQCKKEDLDWKRFLLNRPAVDFDPRKYLEYRLFWPYSSGMPGQWMSHQIDTVHWFSGYQFPRSVVANGGVYMWKDGRSNWDTMTAVFDYGDAAGKEGFQVVFSSRMHNSTGGVGEVYYANGGELNLITNKISPKGGLQEREAGAMGMKANLLPEMNLSDVGIKVETAATAGADPLTSAHMRNWLDCLRSRKSPNAPVEAGFYHSVANIMVNASARTGGKAVYDPVKQQVLVNGKPFHW
jgi:predicted dehydrogenase